MRVYITLPLLYKHIVSLDTEDMLCLGSGQMASPRGVNIIYLGLLLKEVEIHIREFKSWNDISIQMCTKDGQLLWNIVPWLSLFRDALIMEIKQTKV